VENHDQANPMHEHPGDAVRRIGRALVTRSPSVSAERVGRTLRMSQRTGAVSLNRSARWIWELCDGSRTVEHITATLERRLGLAGVSLAGDVVTAVEQLVGLGLVRIQENRSRAHDGGSPTPPVDWPSTAEADWARLAEPQKDGYDTTIVRACAERRDRSIIRAASPHRFLAASIAVDWCYRDDIEPGLVNAPLDHPSLRDAERYVGCWPVAYKQLRDLIGTVHPLLDPRLPEGEPAFLRGSRSHSDEALPGTLYSTINCPLMLALNMVHEMAHQKLFELGVYKEGADRVLLNPPQELHYSAFKSRPRPVSAILHGVVAFAHVMQLEVNVIDVMGNRELSHDQTAVLVGRLARNLRLLEDGAAELRQHALTDGAGTRFLSGLYGWLDRLEEDRRRLSTPAS